MALGNLRLDFAAESTNPIGAASLQTAELQSQLRSYPFEDHEAEVVARGRIFWPWVTDAQNDSAEVHTQRGSLVGGARNIAKHRTGAKPDPEKARPGCATSALGRAGILWLGLSAALCIALSGTLRALLAFRGLF